MTAETHHCRTSALAGFNFICLANKVSVQLHRGWAWRGPRMYLIDMHGCKCTLLSGLISVIQQYLCICEYNTSLV